MKKIAVLILAFSCCLCELQVNKTNDNVLKDEDGCCETVVSIAHTVGAMGEKVKSMTETMTVLQQRMQNAEKEVQQLKSLIGGTPKVAFSAGLLDSGRGNIGPFNIATALKYKRVISNVGNNYNPETGIFTARVKGVYYFRFSMLNNAKPFPNSVVSLKKNGELLTTVWETSRTDAHDIGSNAAVISLEVGDIVYVELWANRLIYDDHNNYNTFSGHNFNNLNCFKFSQ